MSIDYEKRRAIIRLRENALVAARARSVQLRVNIERAVELPQSAYQIEDEVLVGLLEIYHWSIDILKWK